MNTKQIETELLSKNPTELGKLFGQTRQTAHKWRTSGKLPAKYILMYMEQMKAKPKARGKNE